MSTKLLAEKNPFNCHPGCMADPDGELPVSHHPDCAKAFFVLLAQALKDKPTVEHALERVAKRVESVVYDLIRDHIPVGIVTRLAKDLEKYPSEEVVYVGSAAETLGSVAKTLTRAIVYGKEKL